jgi:hypothetical protein
MKVEAQRGNMLLIADGPAAAVYGDGVVLGVIPRESALARGYWVESHSPLPNDLPVGLGRRLARYRMRLEGEDAQPLDKENAFLAEMAAKHLPGRHDQSSHGRHSAANRARQAARELEELREALGRAQASTGTSDARWITPDDAMAMRDKMLAGQPWTDRERNGLNRYSGDAYYGMNGLLRDDAEAIADLSEGQKQEATELIRDAASGMRPTTRPVKTKRFVAGFASFGIDVDTMTREEIYDALRAMKGKRSQEPGFSSMSLAEGYGRDEWPGRIKLELDVPEGTMAAYLDGDVGVEREQELVTIPGTIFEWDDIIIDPPRNTMKGRVILE